MCHDPWTRDLSGLFTFRTKNVTYSVTPVKRASGASGRLAFVQHESANLLENPAVPASALEVLVPADIDALELFWIRAVNQASETVWLQLYDELLTKPPATNVFPPTPIRPGESQLIPVGVRFAIAITALASQNENGTGAPTTALWVDAAYDVGM